MIVDVSEEVTDDVIDVDTVVVNVVDTSTLKVVILNFSKDGWKMVWKFWLSRAARQCGRADWEVHGGGRDCHRARVHDQRQRR